MSAGERFCAEAQARIDRFYRELAQMGEVAPVIRLRLEGFLEAGLVLDLVSRDTVESWIYHYGRRHLGEGRMPDPSQVPADSDDDGMLLPVRWQRAPVHPS